MARPWATWYQTDSWGMHSQRLCFIGASADGLSEDDCMAVGFRSKIQAVLVEPMFQGSMRAEVWSRAPGWFSIVAPSPTACIMG
eukprot:1178238-Amphidinium_carterae.3